MKISELARAAGVNIQTIRFYEREKLLKPPTRDASGYRSYQKSDLDRLKFIRRNHEIGFTLVEIKELLQLHAVLEDMPYPLKRAPKEVQGREFVRTSSFGSSNLPVPTNQNSPTPAPFQSSKQIKPTASSPRLKRSRAANAPRQACEGARVRQNELVRQFKSARPDQHHQPSVISRQLSVITSRPRATQRQAHSHRVSEVTDPIGALYFWLKVSRLGNSTSTHPRVKANGNGPGSVV